MTRQNEKPIQSADPGDETIVTARLEHGGKVFLSASPSARVDHLVQLCRSHGLETLRLDDMAFGGAVRDQLASVMGTCDLVIALFSGQKETPNRAYEVGIAHALKKPTLLLADGSTKLPNALWNERVVRTSAAHLEAVDFWLRQFLDSSSRRERAWPVPSKEPRRPAKKTDWARYADLVQTEWRMQHHDEAQAMVGRALMDAGIELLSQPKFGRRRPDFAGWVDELQGTLGNPFLVELKGSLRAKADRKRAFDQVWKYLSESNSRWALVLFLDGPAKPLGKLTPDDRLVLFQRFDEFTEEVAQKGFVGAIHGLRNRVMHEGAEAW